MVSLSTILAGIVETGLTGVSLRVYSRASAQRRPALLRELLSMRVAFLAVASLLLGGFVVIGGYSSVIVLGFVLCAVGVLFENIGSSYNTWLASNLKLGWIAISNVIRQFVIATLMLALVVGHAPLIWFFVAVVPAGIAQMLVSAAVVKSRAPMTASPDVRAWWPLARRSAPYVFAMALGFVYFRIPLVAVSLLRPGRPTGLFGAPFRLVETLTLMTGFVLTAAVPVLTRAARSDHLRFRYGVKRVVEVSLIIGAAMTVVVATGSAAAVEILAGPKFKSSTGLLELLSLVLVLKFLTTAWGFGLLSVGDFRSILHAAAAATATAAVVSVGGVELIGIYGAVIGVVLAELTLACAYAIKLRGHLGGAGFPLRTASSVAASGLLSCGVLLLPLPQLVRPCVAGVVYAALLLALRAYPPEALELLPWRRLSRAS